MSYTPPNYLRLYRKRSPLTLSDIGYLMGLSGNADANVSRWEKGERAPTIEILLTYHHLFNTSIESFFELQSHITLGSLSYRANHLISTLKKNGHIPKNVARIRFLEQALIRLTTRNEHGEDERKN